MKSVSDVFEYLYANRAQGLPPRSLATVFDHLIWCFSDNGEQILQVQREWLSSQDLEKVKIALEMREALPFDNLDEMQCTLKSISEKWPELRSKCDEVTEHWRTTKP
jgi:hypothetical protein